jgi:hypothetical protein
MIRQTLCAILAIPLSYVNLDGSPSSFSLTKSPSGVRACLTRLVFVATLAIGPGSHMWIVQWGRKSKTQTALMHYGAREVWGVRRAGREEGVIGGARRG